MKSVRFFLIIACMVVLGLQAENSSFKFEGVLGSPVEVINNMNTYVPAFVPYNPIIVEVGAYEGKGTAGLSSSFPYGKIFAFEPNPSAYAKLQEKIQSLKNVSAVNLAVSTSNGIVKMYMDMEGNDSQYSLLPLSKPPERILYKDAEIEVPSITLEEWCKQNSISHIEFLRLDAGGFEFQILRSSPEILKTVLVIVTKTYFHKPRKSISSYYILKRFLETNGFELLAHWYQEGQEGEATFVRKYMYDSLFR